MIARLARLAACARRGAVTAACTNPFVPHYEYEEQVYLSVDGRATVVIDASLPALVALRGLAIDPSRDAADRSRRRFARVVEAAHCRVDSVSRLWTRQGRRFVQVQVTADDVRQLSACGLLAWSSYALAPIEGEGLRLSADSRRRRAGRRSRHNGRGTAANWSRSSCTCRAASAFRTSSGSTARTARPSAATS